MPLWFVLVKVVVQVRLLLALLVLLFSMPLSLCGCGDGAVSLGRAARGDFAIAVTLAWPDLVNGRYAAFVVAVPAAY